jgi:hypothetical protein
MKGVRLSITSGPSTSNSTSEWMFAPTAACQSSESERSVDGRRQTVPASSTPPKAPIFFGHVLTAIVIRCRVHSGVSHLCVTNLRPRETHHLPSFRRDRRGSIRCARRVVAVSFGSTPGRGGCGCGRSRARVPRGRSNGPVTGRTRSIRPDRTRTARCLDVLVTGMSMRLAISVSGIASPEMSSEKMRQRVMSPIATSRRRSAALDGDFAGFGIRNGRLSKGNTEVQAWKWKLASWKGKSDSWKRNMDSWKRKNSLKKWK